MNKLPLKQPLSEFGIETWIDENNRLMMSLPKSVSEQFAVGICNSSGELLGHLVFEQKLRAKTQTFFVVEKWLSPNDQTRDLPNWLQPALGLSHSNF